MNCKEKEEILGVLSKLKSGSSQDNFSKNYSASVRDVAAREFTEDELEFLSVLYQDGVAEGYYS